MTEDVDGTVARANAPIRRTHARFLLRNLQFKQQFAQMYRRRLEALHAGTLTAIKVVARDYNAKGNADRNEVGGDHETPLRRVLDFAPGETAVCVGTLYKSMKLLPRFLDEYQKELVRIDAGDDDDDGEAEEMAVPVDDVVPTLDAEAERAVEAAATVQTVSLCNAGDELFLEDDSGRVILDDAPIDSLCTGLVVGVLGQLTANGHLHVLAHAFCDMGSSWIPRSVPAALQRTPCYIAFVCDLGVSAASEPASNKNRTMLELLEQFLSGDLGDDEMVRKATCISRLVIGGNLIAPTEELRLKKKVKLDPSDHTRLEKSEDQLQQSGVTTSTALMREVDQYLARLAETVEVELMPGDNDPSNAYLPQQPLHPVLLPRASRKTSLKLVTNPFEFVVKPSEGDEAATKADVAMFVTSGQNLDDVCHETCYASDRLGGLSLILHSACACPTAPNTLQSYPFQNADPFLFTTTPHCLVACNQPTFETRLEPLSVPRAKKSELKDEELVDGDESAGSSEKCVRLVCVPSFQQHGAIVLVDVHSPALSTTVIQCI